MRWLTIILLLSSFCFKFYSQSKINFGMSSGGLITWFGRTIKPPVDLGYNTKAIIRLNINDNILESGFAFYYQKAKSMCVKPSGMINICEVSIREKIYCLGVPLSISPSMFDTWEMRPYFGVLCEYIVSGTPGSIKDYRSFNPYLTIDCKYTFVENEKLTINAVFKAEGSVLDVDKNGPYNINKRLGLGFDFLF